MPSRWRWSDGRGDGIPRNTGAWLTTAARNRAIDRARQGGHRCGQAAGGGGLESRNDAPDDEDSGVADDRLRLIFPPAVTRPCRSRRRSPSHFEPSRGSTTRRDRTSVPRARGHDGPAPREGEAKNPQRRHPLPGAAWQCCLNAPEPFSASSTCCSTRVIQPLRAPTSCARTSRAKPSGLARLSPASCRTNRRRSACSLACSSTTADATPRVDAAGDLIPLEEQDRSRWDRASIDEGLAGMAGALRRARPGPYQVQAAIAACHATAARADETDWVEIAALYDRLAVMVPSPVVELNRAVAVAMAEGPRAGLVLLRVAGGLRCARRIPSASRHTGRPAPSPRPPCRGGRGVSPSARAGADGGGTPLPRPSPGGDDGLRAD